MDLKSKVDEIWPNLTKEVLNNALREAFDAGKIDAYEDAASMKGRVPFDGEKAKSVTFG